ncbi:uncharacterized protein VP01_142g25 [Puccinia sorghi]|uniref:Uncharacterized protein n=1 Tax=Puccinia sorghi TaxID=27349 RepID=A0A0L6VMB0_9BASI|nr:uncharacterized protein VP01_142g25 [Puccinia sorghi]
MSDTKNKLHDLSKTSFNTWKQKILGHCQQLGLKKLLTSKAPPPDPTALEAYETNCSKAAGILLSYMGTKNYNRFVTDKNEEDPIVLWKLLTDHYEAKTSGNHAKFYNHFITFQFKGSDLSAYLDTVDEHLRSCPENIVLKLPEKYSSTKEFLYSKQPLTIELVKETLTNKQRDVLLNLVTIKTKDIAMAATKSKSQRREYCSGGKHNPKASHPEKDFWQLSKKTANADQANDSDDAGSRPSRSGFCCVIKAFAATGDTELSYLDSGASHHMFSN